MLLSSFGSICFQSSPAFSARLISMFRASIFVKVTVLLEFVAQFTRRIETFVLYISSHVVRHPSPHLRPPSC